MTPLYLALIVLVSIALLVALSFNHLVRLRNKVAEAWRDVDAQLQRRHDLIPRLAAIVTGYQAHESALFEQLARLRNASEAATGAAGKSAPETALADAFARAVAVAEGYPALRASESYLSLQKEIGVTENEIAAAREIYNGNVRVFNSRIQTFPVSFLADLLGFEPADFFQIADGEREGVSVLA